MIHFGAIGPMEIVIVLMIIGMWVGLIWIVVQWVRFFTRKKGGGNALDIARERYAKGEIDKAAYEEIKKTI